VRLHRVPQRPVDDAQVLAGIVLSLVGSDANVDRIAENLVDQAFGDQVAMPDDALGGGP
jgi:hypothetical protein